MIIRDQLEQALGRIRRGFERAEGIQTMKTLGKNMAD
jgi:hypothetical protein